MRILNERRIKEEELRKQMIEIRDKTYDHFNNSQNKVDIVGYSFLMIKLFYRKNSKRTRTLVTIFTLQVPSRPWLQ